MDEIVTLIVPEAPMPESSASAQQTKIGTRMRLGTLDNAKGNADHLLSFLIEGVRAEFGLESVTSVRKDNAAAGAPGPVLVQLVREAIVVFSAMAD